jgi:hypothetical protein
MLLKDGFPMSESVNKNHVLFGFIFFPMNAGYLDFIFKSAREI